MNHIQLLFKLQNLTASSPSLLRAAVKIRNQANAVVAAHFSRLSGPAAEIDRNGEGLLAEAVAPHAKVFVDVGANRGNWTARFLDHAGPSVRGFLFEVNAACLGALRERFGTNDALEIRDAALSDYIGEAEFFESPASDDLSSLSAINAGAGCTRRVVRITTLDRELDRCGQISFLKVDTEGHDYFVLRGARGLLREKRIDVLQFECNFTWRATGTTISGPVGFLESHGYRVMHLRPEGLFSVDIGKFGPDLGYGVWVAFHEGAVALLAPLIHT